MFSFLFVFLILGAPFFWIAIYFLLKETSEEDSSPLKAVIYLSIYSISFIFLLFMTQR